MAEDPFTGRTVRWTYGDGPVAGKTFEHAFATDGTVTYRMAGTTASPAEKPSRYLVERVNDRVYAVSYLAVSNGYTLTTIVDLDTSAIVSFASNEKELVVQHGRLD